MRKQLDKQIKTQAKVSCSALLPTIFILLYPGETTLATVLCVMCFSALLFYIGLNRTLNLRLRKLRRQYHASKHLIDAENLIKTFNRKHNGTTHG